MIERLARALGLNVAGTLTVPLSAGKISELIEKNDHSLILPQSEKAELPEITPEMIRLAINRWEFEPWFQPQIDVPTVTPYGLEILARWKHPTYGYIYPDQFIPVAEEHDLIDDLTFLLLCQSLVARSQWRKKGINPTLALNVSMKSLSPSFLGQLDMVLEMFNEEPKSIQLELTESTIANNLADALDVLIQVRMMEISISIDDFGTGHSNLAQLRDLSFDELKIDKSFIQSAMSSPKSYSILESSVEIAKKLKMHIVAEGVETLQEWKIIEGLKCDEVQGYFFAKPMPSCELLTWCNEFKEKRNELVEQPAMQPPPIPQNEAKRLQALHALRILDTGTEERFNRIVRLVRNLFDVPIVLISLVDSNRQWFKACVGLDVEETPRGISFCGYAVEQQELLVVEDALTDERFAGNPLVLGAPYIRFYAGYPLHSKDGFALGTLCIIDSNPRTMSVEEVDSLRDFAFMVEAELQRVESDCDNCAIRHKPSDIAS
ncbi:EAL domain-containing protein [Parasalinivibrio latis]|uniref:EAL domain-containing protein n=1 Tax=Parasalinivibrio latis TaxID=2952610 RepID=UPI003DA2BCA4